MMCKSITNGEGHPEGVRQETGGFRIGSKEFDEKPTLNEWVGEIERLNARLKRGHHLRSGILAENQKYAKPKRLWPEHRQSWSTTTRIQCTKTDHIWEIGYKSAIEQRPCPRTPFTEFIPRVLGDTGTELEGADAIAMLNQSGTIRGTIFGAGEWYPEIRDDYFHAYVNSGAPKMQCEQGSPEERNGDSDGSSEQAPSTGACGEWVQMSSASHELQDRDCRMPDR